MGRHTDESRPPLRRPTRGQSIFLAVMASVVLVAAVLTVQLMGDRTSPKPPVSAAQQLWQSQYRTNPVYDCPRNAQLTYRQLDQFVPCPNGATYSLTSYGAVIELDSTDKTAAPIKAVRTGDTVQLRAKPRPGIQPFRTYLQERGGPWRLVSDLAAERLQPGSSYFVVVTWEDPTKAHRAAPVPFRWDAVPSRPS
jgi:hypothetical protein